MKAFRLLRLGRSQNVITLCRALSSVNGCGQSSAILRRNFTEPRQSRNVLSRVTDFPPSHQFARCFSSADLPEHFEIKLPALSPTMESGTIIDWLKKEGDSVSEGEPLCEIQTDKATMTFEAPENGFLAKIILPANTKDIPVGKPIAVIVTEEEDAAAFKNYAGKQTGSSEQTTSQPPPAASPATATSSKSYPEHYKVKMPSLSPTMDAGTLMAWQKKEGDEVNEGDVLCEIQTDKATMTFETPEAGYLAKILIPDNTANVPVGKLICIITPEKEDVPSFSDFAASESAPAATTAAPVDTSSGQQPTPASSTPVPQPIIDTALPLKPEALPAAQFSPNTGRIMASPLARKLAAERGIDLSKIQPQSADGMISAADVNAFVPPVETKPVETKPVAARSVDSLPKAPPVGIEGTDYIDIPISSIRKIIAKRLVECKQTVPHYYLTADIEVDAVMELRKELNAVLDKQTDQKVKLSVNDFIIKASALACRKIPECNSAWMDAAGVIRTYSKVDMSVAVATDQGLITPIVFDAHSKGLSEISTNVIALAKKAREGRLQLNEFQGGTFTISNLGMFGVREFAAVINPPQSCILAVGSASPRLLPAASVTASSTDVEAENLRQATVMSVTLSCDHRVVDGAVGAQWLREFKRLMEKPSLMLL